MALKKQFLKTKPECKVTFEISKEAVADAKSVVLVGDFNDWDEAGIPMKKGKTGLFSVSITLETGKQYQFRYFIDGKRWENDWDADAYATSPFPGIENSVVII